MILGLSGYAQSGKDTAALQLAPFGFERRAFADKLKELAYALNPPIHYEDLRTVVDQRGWESAKRIPAVRQYLQFLGIVHRDILGPNVWVDAAMSDLRETTLGRKIVFTDVRFPNEADAIREGDAFQYGTLIRIERPGTGPVNDHESESALDGYPFDAVIQNDSTPEVLGERLRAVIDGG